MLAVGDQHSELMPSLPGWGTLQSFGAMLEPLAVVLVGVDPKVDMVVCYYSCRICEMWCVCCWMLDFVGVPLPIYFWRSRTRSSLFYFLFSTMTVFDLDRQRAYLSYCLRQLPGAYSKLDTSRMTLVHFAVQSLDLMGVWDDVEQQQALRLNPSRIIDWIYSLQCEDGFQGGSFLSTGAQSHIAMTYTALCALKTLGDDGERLHRDAILQHLQTLQLENGCFQAVSFGSEADLRFLYCACVICHLLDDWSCLNKEKATDYIRSCRSYDGAFALLPHQEGHGGSTFCAVASLVLMDTLEEGLTDDWKETLVEWCVMRQNGGLQGRPNKDEDTCYSYWIGGTLRLLGQDHLLDHEALREFVGRCESPMGGFSKMVGVYPDLLHSFYTVAYLSLSQDVVGDSLGLKTLNCTLGVARDLDEEGDRYLP